MRRMYFIILALAFLSILLPAYSSAPQKGENEHDFIPGEIIIKLKDPGASAEARKAFSVAGIGGFENLDKASFLRIASEKVRIRDFRKLKTVEGTYRIRLEKGQDIISAIEEYRKNPLIEYAEPNYIFHIFAVPNDPSFNQQWSLNITNSTEGWDIETGTNSTAIAIIDTGVEWNHTDLAANIWTNPGEIAGNGVDDDNNGYIDDVNGWDFVNYTSGCTDVDCGTPDNNTMDSHGHGTHVAGIAAAVGNNSVGISGVCWKCAIMPLRAGYAVGADASLEAAAIAEAIYYAANNSARVITMSFGDTADVQTVRNAINYAYSKGVVLVASAGNDNSFTKMYPAAYDNVIAVSSTNISDMKSNFSQYGSWIDVAAPGTNILSTYINNGFASISGTSMSAPFVAGLAGLILSKNSSFTNEQVRTIIRSSVDNLSSPYYIGTGRVNVRKAILRNSSAIADLGSQLDDRNVSGIVSINGTANGTVFVNYSIYYGQGAYPTSWTLINFSNKSVSNSTLTNWDTRFLPNGEYSVRLLVYDNSNLTSEDRAVVNTNNTGYILNIDFCSNLSNPGKLYNLTSNVSSPRTCFTLGADNITLDCNGFTINYSQSEKGYGINNSEGYDKANIRNCKIVQGGDASDSYGIYFNGVSNSTITNNFISTSGEGSYGIHLYASSDSNNISSNNITTNGGDCYGVSLYQSSLNDIRANTISTTGYYGYGIGIFSSSINNIKSNSIATSSDLSHGIIAYYSSLNNITSNNITTAGEDSHGIDLIIVSNYNIVSDNNISTNNLRGHGINLSFSDYNNLTDNIISIFGDEGYGIYSFGSSGNNASKNSIYSNGSYSSGIYLYDSSNTTICNNTIFSDGDETYGIVYESSYGNNASENSIISYKPSSHGIYLLSSSDNNKLEKNVVITENSSSYGIYLEYGTDLNDIINNSITTFGEGSHGIYFKSASANIINKNDIEVFNFSSYGLYISLNSDNNSIANNSMVSVQSYSIYLGNTTAYKPENNSIYNNLLNGSNIPVNGTSGWESIPNNWSISATLGYRIYGNGTHIGGNYYTNSTGDGFSDTCIDDDWNGFCDLQYNISTNGGCNETEGTCGINTDYLPLSSHFNYPPIIENISIVCDDPLNRTNGELHGNFDYYDIDNITSEITLSTKWYWFRGGFWNLGFEDESSINPVNTFKDDIWIFSAGAFDGYTWKWVNSSGFVVENTAPSQPVLLSPAHNANISSSNVSFSWSCSDEDGDTLYYTLNIDENGVASTANTSIYYVVSEGEHSWSITADDMLDLNKSVTNNFTVDSIPPSISYVVYPPIVVNGSNVTLDASFTDIHPGSIWVNITVPNATPYQLGFQLINGTALGFNQTNKTGNYTVVFFANDTFGNIANRSTYFIARPPILFNSTAVAYNGNALSEFSAYVYYNESLIATISTDNGTLFNQLPDFVYDIKFSSLDGAINVTFRDFNLSKNQNRKIGFDNPSVSGYSLAYAINNSYNFTTAVVSLRYSASGSAEDHLELYKCDNWNFSARRCSDGTWTNITASSVQDKDKNSFIYTTSSFSGFAIKQIPFCGDSLCSGEDCNTCPIDCGPCGTIITGPPGGGTTTTTTTITTSSTTTTLYNHTENLSETTTTTIIADNLTYQEEVPEKGGNEISASGSGLEILPFILVPLVIATVGVGYWKFTSMQYSQKMEGLLSRKAGLYKDLIKLEKNLSVLKSRGIETEKIEAELILARRAIDSEAFESAKFHMDNARSLMAVYG